MLYTVYSIQLVAATSLIRVGRSIGRWLRKTYFFFYLFPTLEMDTTTAKYKVGTGFYGFVSFFVCFISSSEGKKTLRQELYPLLKLLSGETDLAVFPPRQPAQVTFSKPGLTPARHFVSPFVPEDLVSRDKSGCPIPRQKPVFFPHRSTSVPQVRWLTSMVEHGYYSYYHVNNTVRSVLVR